MATLLSSMRERAAAKLPVLVIIIAVLFGAVMAWVIIASLVPRRIATYALQAMPLPSPPAFTADTVTIDARDPDQWRFFAFAKGLLMPPDTTGWDLAFRRFHVMVAGQAVSIDSISFATLRAPPAAGYVPTTFDRDTLNQAVARWYRYNMFSHLLRPKPQIYVIRSSPGRYAKLEFLSYYCPGPEPGCVTFRFQLLR